MPTQNDEKITALRMTQESLDRSILANEKALRSSITALRDRLDEAERALNDGRMPNTCGIVQSLGNEIDQLVAKLDTAKTIRANFRAAAEFDSKRTEPDALAQAAQDIIEGWDGATYGGQVYVDVEDIKDLRDALLARDAKPPKGVR